MCVCVDLRVFHFSIDYCARLLDSRDLKVFDDWDPKQQYDIHIHAYMCIKLLCFFIAG